MKTRVYSEEGENKIYLRAETVEENIVLLALTKRTKKPNRAFGHIEDSGFIWIWVTMPAKKMNIYDVLKIDSEGK